MKPKETMSLTFEVESGKFLCFMVNQHGIETNPEKINALLEISSPKKPKEVMSLAGEVAALSHFVLRVIDICAPLCQCAKGVQGVQVDKQM